MKQQKKTVGSEIVRVLLFAGFAFVFLLLFAGATSPLAKNAWGYDSAFFILVGQGITKGLLPYRDFFDMKGPYLFLIEYIGQKIAYGRLGAFVMEWIFLTLTLAAADAIYRLALKKDKAPVLFECVLLLPILLIACATFDSGNYTEEYSLPFLMFSTYLAVRYFRAADADDCAAHPPLYAVFYGFSFGVLALIRITNAATIGAILLTIALHLLRTKQIKNLFSNALAFIAGVGIAAAPMIIYYAAHGVLSEMLTQVFLFGVSYSSEIGFAAKVRILLTGIYMPCLIFPWLPVLVLLLSREKRGYYWLFSVSSAVLICIAITMGNGYLHYFTLSFPNIVLALYFWVEFNDGTLAKKVPKVLRVAVIALVCLGIAGVAFLAPRVPMLQKALGNYSVTTGDYSDKNLQQICAQIPQEDRDSVYVYSVESCSAWYAQAGLFPPNRYCDWQAHYIQLNPQIGDELESWLRGDGAKWIVGSVQYPFGPKQIRNAIEDNYTEYFRNSSYILYIRNDV